MDTSYIQTRQWHKTFSFIYRKHCEGIPCYDCLRIRKTDPVTITSLEGAIVCIGLETLLNLRVLTERRIQYYDKDQNRSLHKIQDRK